MKWLAFIFVLLAGCGDVSLDKIFDALSRPTPAPTAVATPIPTPTNTPAPTATPAPTPHPTNPLCVEEMRAQDGPNGFLWKPSGDHTGALVVLLPARFFNEFDTVVVDRKDGELERLSFTGFSNGNRQTWRGKQHGRHYKNNQLVRAVEHGNICAWRIKNAAQRND